MSFKPKFFTQIPAEKELEVELDKYNAVFGIKIRKVGICRKDRINNRYTDISKYKVLNESSIFATTNDWRIAVSIEESMKDILASQNICGNALRDTKDSRNPDEVANYIVYLTELHSDLFCCPVSECSFVSRLEYVEKHISSHQQILKIQQWQRKLEKFNANFISSSHIKPQRFIHVPYKSTVCKYCGQDFEGTHRTGRHDHELTCPDNPTPKYPCTKCDKRFKTDVQLETHLRAHDTDEKKREKELEFECIHCHRPYARKKIRDDHQRLCPKNPNRLQYFCPNSWCDKVFFDPSAFRRHKGRCKEEDANINRGRPAKRVTNDDNKPSTSSAAIKNKSTKQVPQSLESKTSAVKKLKLTENTMVKKDRKLVVKISENIENDSQEWVVESEEDEE
ncbi:hypothetical protein PVAND_013072 [Polypedilum vanderplanki]|uniref:C2H2-type domain-containing protein n=1 Tax=Polypedilum vanderplanki TaxID=319348 RepID=A0A9J6CPC2_POLVA|nr:hypothetical protein PVAND_013072 [Polypedilum vanderplanki]